MFVNDRKKLSEQVRIELLKYIEDMREKEVRKLPSEDNLAALFKVSRTTIRTVLGELESEGILMRKHGRGTFINEKTTHLNAQFTPVTLYIDMIKEFGYKAKAKHIGRPAALDEVSEEIRGKLNLNEEDKVVLTRKLLYADEKPCVFCIDYFPLKLLEEDDLQKIDNYKESLFDFFKIELGKEIVSDQVEITTTTSDERKILKDHFSKNVKSFLQLNCINFDEDGKPVIYAEEYVDTDLIRFFSLRKK